jgi:Actinobacteria/chloroflexi VLRF1 release factor
MAKRGAGVPRWVEVTPERIEGWIVSFAERHGETTAEPGPDVVVFRAADGAVAECHVPFPPLRGLPPAPLRGAQETGGAGSDPEARQVPPGQAPVGQASPGQVPVGQVPPDRDPVGLARLMATHAAADRTVAVLLVRLGGYAVGVFSGSPPRLEASKVGTRLVHGRSAAGGWSQHRFARRREKQAATALGAAADTAVAVFGPHLRRLDAVVLGGDRRTVAGLRDDPRLGPYYDLAVDRFLTVPDPRLAVLRETPRMFRCVRIWIADGEGAGD